MSQPVADRNGAASLSTPGVAGIALSPQARPTPPDLAAWAAMQARKEGSNLSEKFRAFLRQWQADVQAAEAAAEAQKRAEIEAAVAKALKAKRKAGGRERSRGAKAKDTSAG